MSVDGSNDLTTGKDMQRGGGANCDDDVMMKHPESTIAKIASLHSVTSILQRRMQASCCR